MKKNILCLVLTAVIALLPAASLAREAARGFDTPEACAQALFAALQAQDVAAMEACIAFDELAASFDFRAHTERIHVILGASSLIPPNNPFALEYNSLLLRRTWYMRLEGLSTSALDLKLNEALFQGVAINENSEDYARVLQLIDDKADFDIFPLLQYQGIVTPDMLPSISEKYYSDKNTETMRRMMAEWHVDGYTELGIECTVSLIPQAEGELRIMIPLRLVQLNGLWLIDPSTPVLGMLMEMNATDFAVLMP